MQILSEQQDTLAIFYVSDHVMGGPDGVLLHDALHKAIEAGARYAIIDLAGVAFMNSSGLGMLISGMTTMRNNGGDLVITNPSPKVVQLLELTRLNSIFQQFESVSAAQEALTA